MIDVKTEEVYEARWYDHVTIITAQTLSFGSTHSTLTWFSFF